MALVRGRAGVLLYMVDCAFRVLQQAQPVHITRADASADGSLVTVLFHAGPFTPIHAIQARPVLETWCHLGPCGSVSDPQSVDISFPLHGSTAHEMVIGSAPLGVFRTLRPAMQSRIDRHAAWLPHGQTMVRLWRQDLFIGVVGLSPIQWHPFTTRAGPEGHTLLAHVKGYGSWTQVPAPMASS